MDQRQGYKKTKIGWIPDDWEVKNLGQISEFSNGKAHEKSINEHGDYIVVNSKFISTDGAVVKRSNQNLSPLLIGNIVMVMSDVPNGKAIAKCFQIEKNDTYTLNQRICSITAIKMNPDFLFFILNRNKYYLQFDNGVGQTNLKKTEVLGCPVPLPLLPEQQKIASILTTVDDKISSIENQIQQTEQLKKGLMEKLLTEGIGHTAFKDTKIGRIPEGWDISTLGKHILLISGQHINSEDYNEEGKDIPYITGPADYPHGKIVATKFTEKPQVMCETEDILMTCKGSGAGSLTIADMDCCISRQIMAIRSKSIVKGFTLSILEKAQNTFRKNAVGLIPGISRPDLLNFFIPLPPIEEQKQIASILSTVDNKIEVLTQKKSQYQTLKKGLSQQLLTGQMRVKV
ncbi:restriction endonuclease subunit S [Desulfobacula sp.]